MTNPRPLADETIPVVVIDAHDVVAAGIRNWSPQHSLRVLASHRSAQSYLDGPERLRDSRVIIVFDPECGDKAPDFVAVEQLASTESPVIAYSRTTSPEIVLRCVDHGATTYVAKSEPQPQLIEAIRAAWAGEIHRSATLTAAEQVAALHGRPHLTPQERRVALTWLHTTSKTDVAGLLHVASTTVRTHVQRIRTRYRDAGRPAPDKAALLARLIQDGYVGPGEL